VTEGKGKAATVSAMDAYRGSGGMTPFILNIVNITSRSLEYGEIRNRRLMDHRLGLYIFTDRINLLHRPAFEPRNSP
jgi:hypothetical protein